MFYSHDITEDTTFNEKKESLVARMLPEMERKRFIAHQSSSIRPGNAFANFNPDIPDLDAVHHGI